jgi:hypothetical protein
LRRLGEILRKHTTPVHWACGVLCGVFSIAYFPAGVLLLAVYAGNQVWNDWENMKKHNSAPEGCSDWWEMLLTYSIVIAIAIILHLAGVISIRWI